MNWPRFFRRKQRDAECARDLQFYLEAETGDNLARGLSPAEARAAAQRKLGNSALIREEIYRMNSLGFLETFWRDALYALRTMRKNPAFAATAILTLALGIGGNTAMFTVIHAVLLKPLAYRDPDRLVRISVDQPEHNLKDVGFTQMRYEEMKAAVHSFTELGAFFIATENLALSGGAGPEALKAARVSANFLHVLGVEPVLGRGFRPEEDTLGAPPAAMIAAGLWRRRFGGDPLVTGKVVTLDSRPYTIVGVLPPGFQFPFPGVDVWVTRPSDFSAIPPQLRRITSILVGIARLRPGVSLEGARTEMAVL
ncbi:MAG: ABC transporter permease, partial [Bryobacteraceae bacterium]